MTTFLDAQRGELSPHLRPAYVSINDWTGAACRSRGQQQQQGERGKQRHRADLPLLRCPSAINQKQRAPI
jgi:hypothetical protein